MPSEVDAAAVRRACQETLERNWTEGVRASDRVSYAYTRPSPSHYPWQWFWDSCFSAIARRHLDRDRARRELQTLLAAGRSDGFIGHTIFWGGPPRDLRRCPQPRRSAARPAIHSHAETGRPTCTLAREACRNRSGG